MAGIQLPSDPGWVRPSVTRALRRAERDWGKHLWTGLLAVTPWACSDSRQVLLVHSPLDTETLDWVEQRYEADHPDTDLRWIQIPPEETLRLLREGAAEEWPDLWWGAPAWLLATAAGEDRLASASPTWAGDVGDEVRDPAGRWIGVLLDPLVMAFDREQVSLGQAPRDWIDLFHPRWAGELLVPDAPGTLSGSLLVGTLMGRDVLQGGDGSDGLDWLRRLDATVSEYPGDEEDAARRLGRGEGAFAVLRLSTAVQAGARRESVVWRVPETGTPVLVEGAARVAGSMAGPAAEEFLEWLGSGGVMQDVATRLRRLPVFPTGADTSEPAFLALDRVTLRIWPMDADSAAVHLESWIERWREQVRGAAPRIF
jgi:iron(III) transport system substrate-binding protein